MNTTKLKLNETNPEQTPVQTRDGREAGIYWVGEDRIHGWVGSDKKRSMHSWGKCGEYVLSDELPLDLINKPAEPDWTKDRMALNKIKEIIKELDS